MEKKYFLYIDILGFAEIAKNDPNEIERIYNIIDSLNVHKHEAFKTIIFSDTILVYNIEEAVSNFERESIVMFACEFAQDLIYHFADKDIYFRAILTYDYFKHYSLKYAECYYGNALINCYNKEKEINGIGLFIDKRITQFNKIFPTVDYDKDFDYVCVLQSLERLNRNTNGLLPSSDFDTIDNTDEYWSIKFELNLLRNIYLHSLKHSDVKIRSKFLQTYQLYRNLFKTLLISFEKSNFDVSIINPKANWSKKRKSYDE